MIALILILMLLALNLLLHILAIKLGAKWAKVPGVTFHRAVWVSLLLGLASLLASSVVGALLARVELTLFGSVAVPLAVTVVVECLLVGVLLRTSVWRGVRAWLPKLGAFAAMTAVMFLVVKPFVAGAFVEDSHSMAPTLLGPHVAGTCPHCGGSTTVSVDSQFHFERRVDNLGMCSACQQVGEAKVELRTPATAADRLVVCNLLPPTRWDVVAVYSPAPSRGLGTSRVVGLPGEEVAIRDGSVWANGVKLEPPADIAKLKYTSAPDNTPDGFGSPDHPVQLGPDEYFVIGDFSLHSVDSRIWGPVPRKDITGVVSLVYFPFNRWRLMK